MKSEERKNGENTALWGGRFSQSLDQQVLNYSASLHFDSRLAPQDIRGSKAHAAMLSQVGILSAIELQQINGGFETIEAELAQGTFPFRPELEDIHMNIETRLTELIGDVGKKLHTGRSRNDQVALDLRLFCRDVADGWQLALSRLISAFIERAELTKETLFPASTHLQAAQPISWAHYFLAFAAMFERDLRRLESYKTLHDVSPLGAGALAGTTLPIDPAISAKALGFARPFFNSYDVVGDRDFILELLQIASQIMLHVSRLAEDLVYYSSTLVGLVDLPDKLCTGSSMMPQKKNPDILELARGKTATVLGSAQAMVLLLKGLPSSYNRDLQQDKEHLFPAVDIVSDTLALLPVVISQLQILEARSQELLASGFLMATDLAEALVKRGVPFRRAHEIVGATVGELTRKNRSLISLTVAELQQHYSEADADLLESLKPARVLQERSHSGSTGLKSVADQISELRQALASRSI